VSKGFKKVPSGHPGQVDFPSGLTLFIHACPMGKRSGNLYTNQVVKIANLQTITCPRQAKFNGSNVLVPRTTRNSSFFLALGKCHYGKMYSVKGIKTKSNLVASIRGVQPVLV